jgi:tryptophan 2,3-dioxygenase
MNKELIEKIEEKYTALGIDPDVALEGLLHSSPMTYWDYIQPDALLSLQVMRTKLPDEMIFIMYHQINELLFKMILWEIGQIADNKQLTTKFFSERLSRISRYFDMLSESFNIMGDGMEVGQYMQFRNTLTPASGFQCASYREIEFCSTELINLTDQRYRSQVTSDMRIDEHLELMYWQAAGKDYATGEKSTLLTLFEDRYKDSFVKLCKQYKSKNLWTLFKSLPEEERNNVDLLNSMRHYDHTVNVKWVMAHYDAAGKYLDSGEESVEATGGSDWRKYMHPKYQRRIFFPDLWSAEELETWGVSNLEGYKSLQKAQ